MALTILPTPGDAAANSFVSAAEMTAYCEGRLNASVWTGAAAQEPALVEATRTISLLEFLAARTDSTQALSWPRTYCPNPDAPADATSEDVIYFASDVVPQRVKDATCELALQFLKAGATDLAMPDATAGVTEKTVDVLTTKYADPAYRATSGIARFPRVRDLLAPLLASTAGGLTVVRS